MRASEGLGAAHAIPAIVAQVTVAIPHRDGSAVVAGRGIGLEGGELVASAVSPVPG